VEERKIEYVNSKRLEKPLVALDIIRKWRKEQVPPGRFLKVNESSGLWDDVGDKKAREKTSQALREKAPVIRKQCQEEEEEQQQQQQQHYQLTNDPTTVAPFYNHHLPPDILYNPPHHNPYHTEYTLPPPQPYSSSIRYENSTTNQPTIPHPQTHIAYHHPHPTYPTLQPQPDIYHSTTNPSLDNDTDAVLIPCSFEEQHQEQHVYATSNNTLPANTTTTSTTTSFRRPQQQGMMIKKQTSIKFAEGTKDGSTVVAPSKAILKPNISRYHSLGTDMPDEDALKGFSWESPDIGELTAVETSSSTTSMLDKEAASSMSPHTAVAAALSTRPGTVIEEDDYYYLHRMDASEYPHVTSPTTYRSKLQRDHSLAMNPLRHATTREPASTYRHSLDQDLEPFYHQQQHPQEEEEVYNSTYTIQQADHRQQQHSTLTIRKNNTPHNSSTSDVYSPYPPASDTSHYRSLHKKEPYSHYYNNTTANNALEPLYYQDELGEDHPSAQPYQEFWPEAAPQDYDQDVISQTGYSVQQPYVSSVSYSSTTVPRTTSRASGSGERIHVPASSPSINASRTQPLSTTLDYHPITRQEYRTGPTVLAAGANADSGRTHRDYREKIHSAVPTLERTAPQDYLCSERMTTAPANAYNTKDAVNQIGPDQSARVVLTPRASGGSRSYANSRARQSNSYYYHHNHHHDGTESSRGQNNLSMAPLSSSHCREEEDVQVPTKNFEANANIVRPLMKRDTSHQNENPVTKKETKLRRSGAENESEGNQLRQLRSDNLTLNSTWDDSMNKLTPFIADINLGDRSRSNQTSKPDTRLPKPVPITMHSRTETLDFFSNAFLLDEEGDHLSDAPDASLLLGEDE
jgi:hypothetical protein